MDLRVQVISNHEGIKGPFLYTEALLQIQYNLCYLTLLGEEQLVQIIEGSDNRRAKITGLNGDGRVVLRSDN